MLSTARAVKVVARTTKYFVKHALGAVFGVITSSINIRPRPRDLEEFHLFSQLPADIRVKIWPLIDLEPRVVVMRKTSRDGEVPKYRFACFIPGVLHACRESRHEFLNTNDENGSGLVHQRDHPTYKIYCKEDDHISCPVLFSDEIDTLWGMKCTGPEQLYYEFFDRYNRARHTRCQHFGLTQLEMTPNLERLVIYLDRDIVGILTEFPSLKHITFIVPTLVYGAGGIFYERYSATGTSLKPEVDGGMSYEGLEPDIVTFMRNEHSFLDTQLLTLMEENPGWSPPRFVFRAAEQFTASECPEVTIDVDGWRVLEDPS